MAGQLQFKWDQKNLEIRTRSVEQQLEPLVIHVTTLVNTDKSVRKGKGKSKKAVVLVAAMEKAVKNFIEKGEQIANENPDIGKQMLEVVEEIRRTGDIMSNASREFAVSPCDSQKRTEMVKAARNLLAAVTRLLILADMIDVHLLLKSIQLVEADLEHIRIVKNRDELMESLKNYQQNSRNLLDHVARRQHELKDPQIRDDLAAARAVLKKSSTMLLSASKAYASHPDIPAAKANRDHVLKQICEAVETISSAAQGKAHKSSSGKFEEAGKLATNLDTFERKQLNYDKERSKVRLEQQLEEMINGAILITESGNIKDERKNKIMAGCDAVREALQGLLNQTMKGMDKENALDDVSKKTRDLRRQLRKVVADKVSDSFLETNTPLLALVAAAEKGDLQEVENCAAIFNEHCNKLIEVANLVCEMSNNEDGVKMVRYAASQLATLCPGVVDAARLLAAQPHSSAAKDNMKAFKQSWENQVQLLLDAVDDITTIDDVLAVLDTHIYDDMSQYMIALQERNPVLISALTQKIKGRSDRICDVVTAEMDNYEPCLYTRRVLEAVKMLTDELIPSFDRKTKQVVQVMNEKPDQEIDENEFIDATRLVYDGVREVRRAVLMNRADEDLDPEEVELEDTYVSETLMRTVTQRTEVTVEENVDDMGGITVAREALSKLPEKEKSRILEQVENFQTEKLSFDREVAKWDDTSNDIVVLAKHMCIIMISMTDFVRQRGPLKTTHDVISAAKRISEIGVKLDKLARQIAEQCPESSTKNDLFAYLERVALYCHQINIISKVKRDVQNSNEELILAGVESATSLIENAKNLMNAVVLTVKASYVASTKYSRQAKVAVPIVWKMKAPQKKPLVRLEKPKEVRAVVRRGSEKRPQNPIRVLAEFQSV